MDYSHRNPDGSVGKVPDSLISEFKTQSGRKVYDGGGISPDIKITPEDYARITQELVLQDLTFDFINSYALRHPNIAPINEFKITDEIYNEFKTYLKEKKFSYETESPKPKSIMTPPKNKLPLWKMISPILSTAIWTSLKMRSLRF